MPNHGIVIDNQCFAGFEHPPATPVCGVTSRHHIVQQTQRIERFQQRPSVGNRTRCIDNIRLCLQHRDRYTFPGQQQSIHQPDRASPDNNYL